MKKNLDIIWTNQFKKDYKLAMKRNLRIDLLDDIIRKLARGDYGHKIDAPTLRGNTGMLEVGLSFKPASVKNMSIDFGVESYTGRREGIVGSLKAYYAF